MRPTHPFPGLVIRYAYLWRNEFALGREEARKDRPCAVVLVAPVASGGTRVYVLPITHTLPIDPAVVVEIPLRVKRHIGLDDDQSWIVLDEINDFLWPGYDLRAIPGSTPSRNDYGVLPPRFFERVREAFLALALARKAKRVPRD